MINYRNKTMKIILDSIEYHNNNLENIKQDFSSILFFNNMNLLDIHELINKIIIIFY